MPNNVDLLALNWKKPFGGKAVIWDDDGNDEHPAGWGAQKAAEQHLRVTSLAHWHVVQYG